MSRLDPSGGAAPPQEVGKPQTMDVIPLPSTNPLHSSLRSSASTSSKVLFDVDSTNVSSYRAIPPLGTCRNLVLLFFFSLTSAWVYTLWGTGSDRVYIMQFKMSPLWGTSVSYICSIFGICSQHFYWIRSPSCRRLVKQSCGLHLFCQHRRIGGRSLGLF
jgi:hypothetical protein